MEYLHNAFGQDWLSHVDIYLRVLTSGALGLFIGWERSNKNKPAGLKTYMYVSIACTLITIVSIDSAKLFATPNSGTMMDPMRLAAQIVSGLGFLGAGVIIKDGLHIKGLTSAAMIFFVGGVGIGIGAGFYGIVIFSVFLAFVLARFSAYMEHRQNKSRHHTDCHDDEYESHVV